MGRNYFLYLSVAITIAITVGSLISVKDIGQPPAHVSDKLVHFSGYFVLAFSWFLTFNKKFKLVKPFLLIAVVVFVYGIVIEVCQVLFTASREADGYDILANLGGVLASLLVFTAIFRKK